MALGVFCAEYFCPYLSINSEKQRVVSNCYRLVLTTVVVESFEASTRDDEKTDWKKEKKRKKEESFWRERDTRVPLNFDSLLGRWRSQEKASNGPRESYPECSLLRGLYYRRRIPNLWDIKREGKT